MGARGWSIACCLILAASASAAACRGPDGGSAARDEKELDGLVRGACSEWTTVGEQADASTLTPADWSARMAAAAASANRAAEIDPRGRAFADALDRLSKVQVPEDVNQAVGSGTLADYVVRQHLDGDATPFLTVNDVCRQYSDG